MGKSFWSGKIPLGKSLWFHASIFTPAEYLAGLKFGSKMRNCWIAGGKENHRSRFSRLAFNSKKSKKVWSGQFISTMHPFISTKWDPYVGWIFERAILSQSEWQAQMESFFPQFFFFCKDMSLNMTLCWLCVWPKAKLNFYFWINKNFEDCIVPFLVFLGRYLLYYLCTYIISCLPVFSVSSA